MNHERLRCPERGRGSVGSRVAVNPLGAERQAGGRRPLGRLCTQQPGAVERLPGTASVPAVG